MELSHFHRNKTDFPLTEISYLIGKTRNAIAPLMKVLLSSNTPFLIGSLQAPDKVEIEEHCCNFSAKLMWNTSRKNNDPIKYFIVETATNNDTKWRRNESDQIDPKLNKTTIKGLLPWTKYRFRVLAFNEIGESDPSEPTRSIICETPELAGNAQLAVGSHENIFQWNCLIFIQIKQIFPQPKLRI